MFTCLLICVKMPFLFILYVTCFRIGLILNSFYSIVLLWGKALFSRKIKEAIQIHMGKLSLN